MNSLQIGLIGIGAIVVALLFLWHWWQSRRAERLAELASASSDLRALHGNATMQPSIDPPVAARIEPVFDAHPPVDWVAGQSAVSPSDVSPAVIQTLPPAVFAAEAPAPESVPVLAPQVAVVASAPPPVERVAPAAPKLRSDWPFDERLHVHASVVNLTGAAFDAAPFVAAAGRAVGWVRLFRQSPWESYDAAHVGSVQQLVLALPLASRQGPIEAQDMDAWQFVLSELATSTGCEIHFHGFRDAPQRATELDSFLAAVDIMPDVYLVKKDGGHWTGTRLRGTLEANGFRLQSDGRFAYHEVESEAVTFHAVDGFERPFTPERLRTEAITALRFSIEPVRLTNPLVRYDSFRQSLRALSKLLDADLKSSDGDLLDDAKFATMREEVKTAMDAIVGAGIEPGSDTARSLFS